MSDHLTPDWEFADYMEDGDLRSGPYTLAIERTATSRKNGSVLLSGTLLGGPDDTNGKPMVDSTGAGRDFDVWIPFYQMASVPKFRQRKAQNVAKKIMSILGEDPQEWPGQSIGLNVSISPNKSGGDPWVNVDDVRPVDD